MIVVFEGIPGSGKTSIIEVLAKELGKLGYTCSISNFQNSGPIVNKFILNAKKHQFGETARNYDYFLAISHHIMYLKMHMKKNEIILAEDFWGSLPAYAEWSFVGFDESDPFWDEYPIFFELETLTFLLDTPVKIAAQKSQWTKLHDAENAEKLTKRYHELAKKHGWERIKFMASLEKRAKACLKIILEN